VDAALSRLKSRPYRLDRDATLGLLAAVVLRRSFWLTRGFFKGLVLQRGFFFFFMAGGGKPCGAARVKICKGGALGRGVIIDGLMRHGTKLGDHVRIGPYSILLGAPISNLGEGITMGANSAIDAYSFIGGSGPVTIGENVIMGQHVCFHPENHNFDQT